ARARRSVRHPGQLRVPHRRLPQLRDRAAHRCVHIRQRATGATRPRPRAAVLRAACRRDHARALTARSSQRALRDHGAMRTADVIVVGLGALGSAAAWQLAARGLSVIGIDRYAPPHAWGSTHGDTRITRLAIGEGREYVPLARRSHELWREIEIESGAELLTQTGIVVLGDLSSTFLAETRAVARQYGIDHRALTND